MLQVNNLTKTYGDFKAIDNISFEIKPGEIFGFLGPNGAGKTTTIKILVGLLKPTSGSIIIDGKNIIDNELEFQKLKYKMSYIPDTPTLYDKLTGWEFLKFINNIYECNWNESEKLAIDYLNRFGILKNAEKLIETYSHGMKQKLSFVAALIHKPKILIVDEPMVGLDPKNMLIVKQIFQEIASSNGIVFLSTHMLSIAEQLCSRIAILSNGNLIANGTLNEIKNKFNNLTNNSNLEEIFLKLTSYDENIKED